MFVIEYLSQYTYLQATNVLPPLNQPIQQHQPPAPAGNQVAVNAIVPSALNAASLHLLWHPHLQLPTDYQFESYQLLSRDIGLWYIPHLLN